MTLKIKPARALPAELGDSLSPSEQAHMDSAGADALAAPAPTSDEASEPAAGAPPDPSIADVGTGREEGRSAAPSSDTPDTKPRMVPHAALHEEREARKAAEKRATMLEERTGLILEALRTGKIGGVATARDPEAAAVPAFGSDPAAHVLGRLDRADQLIGTVAQLLVGQHQAGQQRTEAEAAWNRARVLEEQHRVQNPDHDSAMDHLRRTRHGILAALGMRDAVQRDRQIAQELQHAAQVAARENQNPAEMLYALAQAIGYRKAGAAGPGAPASGEAAAKLAAAAAGQRQAGALGTVRGTGPAPLTVARLVEMSDAEFARAISTPEGRALLGA